MEKKLLVNGMITPDGTELISHHVHDFVSHKDLNGETYFIDGGPYEYGTRQSVNKEKAEKIWVYSTDKHDVIREYFEWGTYGKDGKDKLSYVKLKNMTNEHIENILNTQIHIERTISEIFKEELKFRKKN